MGKRKMLIVTTAGYLLLILMIMLVGCAQPAPSPAPAPPPASKPATVATPTASPSPTAKPATITLTGVTYQAVTSSISVPMTMLKEKRAANSKGQIVLNIKGGPEAIGAFDQPEAVRKGVVDLALSIATYTQSLEPGAAMAAYIGVSPMDVRKNGLLEILEQVYNRINLKFLGMAQWPADRLLNSTKLMKEPEELKGLSIRSSGGQEELTLKHFGATPNALPWGDAYTALQTGVIQGYFGSTASTAEMKLYDVTK